MVSKLRRSAMLVVMVLLVPLASPAANPAKSAIAPDPLGEANHERMSPTLQTNQPIAWADLGAKATTQYSGDGLAVSAAADGTSTH